MELAYLFIVIFLFTLAIIDLTVGVSNDAVNFLSAAVGSKAAKLKWILLVAALGVFIGASFSSGMMDIARHGIFNPNFFYFSEVMCIFLAVVISDVFLLDLFNSLGLPTSTTVSMVFELLGASFIVSLIKISSGTLPVVEGFNETAPTMANLLNSDKALTMIISIFLSVAIAFLFGLIVQWISRLLFTFHFRKNLGKKIGVFGGVAVTSIMYFMLIKGLKGSTLVTPEVQAWVDENTTLLLLGSFVFFTIFMQVLHWFKVNVFRIIVLIGTFSLAMAFAGNDLVNFIGVTLAGFSSFMDFTTNAGGTGAGAFVMNSLAESAKTPVFFLIGAGAIMVFALYTSKKAKKVLQTSIDLTSQQNEENEMFGTSSIARNIVRSTTNMIDSVSRKVPQNVKDWVNSRFRPLEDRSEVVAFDLVRASVNLVLAGLLIAVGTSMKLPLSTTYVAFMVGMGSSLADRAWSRESAVYRVTGVVSVVGGWFVTAGAAFLLASIVATIMYFGGIVAMFIMIALVIYLLIHSHIRYNKKQQQVKVDEKMEIIFKSDDKAVVWEALKGHASETLDAAVSFSAETYKTLFEAFVKEEVRPLKNSLLKIVVEKKIVKKTRRCETQGFQRVSSAIALERSTWYHLCTNSCLQMYNTLTRIGEPMREHTDNSFSPLEEDYIQEFSPYCRDIYSVLCDIAQMIRTGDYSTSESVSLRAKELKHKLAALRKEQTMRLHKKSGSLKMDFVYLNLIQESHELLSEVRNLLRGSIKMFAPYSA
ncbi:MAG: inorganic phosphate transporter [Bacteroidales bacterium]|nr:inorganic phosphate transporter [Bacteroidales bacterium]MBR2606662.1 inorganic phosphate transporter [Bacteroidaceae bacterium]